MMAAAAEELGIENKVLSTFGRVEEKKIEKTFSFISRRSGWISSIDRKMIIVIFFLRFPSFCRPSLS